MRGAVYARILLTLLSLLTLATSAHAECAWVLWTNTTNVGAAIDPERHAVLKAYSGKADCDREAASVMKRGTGVVDLAGRSALSITAVCLPDTIDPRGPKGK